MTDLQFCEHIRLRASSTDAQRVDLLVLLMEATDRLAKAAEDRDEARKAAMALKQAIEQMCFFERHEILDAAEAHWPWLKETSDD